MKGVFMVEWDKLGGTAKAVPGRFTIRVHVVYGIDVELVLDIMVEKLLKLFASKCHTTGEVCTLLQFYQLLDLLHGVTNILNIGALYLIGKEGLRVVNKWSSVIGEIDEQHIEEVATPIDALLDFIRTNIRCF